MRGLYEAGRFSAFASINQVQGPVDVFVSHKSDDQDKAKEVAQCIDSSGLTTWLDVVDLEDDEDGFAMAQRIGTAIARSFSLMAVVTVVTNESWWVPFEIGIAYNMGKQLAAYCEHPIDVNLPSFLWGWPLVQDHGSLHVWCRKILEMDRSLTRLVEASNTVDRLAYTRDLAVVRAALQLHRYR